VISLAISDTNTRIQVTIPIGIKEDLELKAKNNNRSLSNYVFNLILQDLEKEQLAKAGKIN